MNGILAAIAAAVCLAAAPVSADAQVRVAAPVTGDTVQLHVIDVDQGAASLFETPCGTLLIDGGGRTAAHTTRLLEYLAAYFAARPHLNKKFAAVFLTHPHIDHSKSLLKVDEIYEFGGYIDDGRPYGDGAIAVARKLTERYAGARSRHVNEITFANTNKGYTDKVIDPLVCRGVKPKVTALAGGRQHRGNWSHDAFKNTNNHSLVIRIDYGAASFLFLGDLETEGQEALVEKYAGTPLLDIDVLFVPHHGADNGATPELLRATTPKIAVISSGDPDTQEQWTAWDHGHPRKSVIDRLQSSVSSARAATSKPVFSSQNTSPVSFTVTKAIFSTGWDGDIVVSAEGDGDLTVRTER